MTPPPSNDTISFDVDKFYLGKLCKHGHDFHGCGYSLRRLKKWDCVDCNRESVYKWKKANPEKVRKWNKKWEKANIERERKRRREWKKANPEKIRKQKQRYRLKKAQNKLLADLIKFQQLLQEQENDSKCSSIHP